MYGGGNIWNHKEKFLLQKNELEEFPGGPVLGLRASIAEGMGSIPCWGTKILKAVQRGQKQNKTKKQKQIFLIPLITVPPYKALRARCKVTVGRLIHSDTYWDYIL